jgi:flagellar basal body-associated protein FliL
MDTQTTTYVSPRRKKNRTMAIIIIVIVVLLVIGGLFMMQKSGKNTETVSLTPAVSPTQEPSPTPTPKIDKSSVKIQVQNGTGTPGQAAKTVEALTKAGYSADNIKTGNASENVKVTTIKIQSGYENVAEDIKKSLAEMFTSFEIDSTKLEDSSEFNVIVTTGGEEYEEPTAAVTAKPTSTPAQSASPSATINPSSTTTPTATPKP